MIRKDFLKKYLISIFILGIISTIFFTLFYKFEIKLKNISDSIFVINIIVFAIALIFQTGATRSLMSMNYTLKTWFKRKATKERYDSFKDYYEQHEKEHQKDLIHIIAATLTYILIAVIIALI